MGAYCLVHLGDGDLERALAAAAARDRASTASLLAHLGGSERATAGRRSLRRTPRAPGGA